jgi:hypothetical protein
VVLCCLCVLFCCVGECVEEFLVVWCFELGSFSYAGALVCVGEGVSVVSVVFELEGIESADQRPDSVDGAPIIFQKEAFPFFSLSNLVNVGLRTRNFLGELVDTKQSFVRYALSICLQE